MALDTAVRTEFLRLLEQDADFRTEVRRQLLTAELIELPERFAAFVTRVDGFIARTEEFMVRTEEFMVEQKAINARVTERFDGVDQRFDGVDQRFDGVDQRFDEVDQRLDRMDTRMQAITDDLGVLKGHAAGRAARDHVETILDRLGLAYVTILDRRDLVDLLRRFPDIPTGERQSFYRADLVLEAVADDGTTRYVAVEASYTADRRDSDRARRNAGFLTRCTGRPAHAVVASLRNDRDVQALVDAGTVHWHRLTEKDLDPD